MELYEILGNGFVLLGLLAGSAWLWDSRNEDSRRGSWLLSIIGLIFWSSVVLVPLAVIAGFAWEAWK